jgi:hypothetical protein
MTAPNTHFEQIPVETVKKIAQELPAATEIDDVTDKKKDEIMLEPRRWREMAQKVQLENDPQKMMKLVEDLIAAFDEEELRKSAKARSTDARNLGPSPVSNSSHDPSSARVQLGSENAPDSLK